MHLTYTLNGTSQALHLSGDDIPALLRDTQQQLTERHPDIGADPQLPIRIADGLLNALAENLETIHLGELAEPGH